MRTSGYREMAWYSVACLRHLRGRKAAASVEGGMDWSTEAWWAGDLAEGVDASGNDNVSIKHCRGGSDIHELSPGR